MALAKDEKVESVLFIQHSVSIDEVKGGIRASAGHSQILWPWHPDDDDLRPLTYRYKVPEN